MSMVRTTCPYCGVGCGLLAAPDGAITGAPDHPANFGRTCSKGAALGEALGLDGRLVGMIGGLGGLILPIVFGILLDSAGYLDRTLHAAVRSDQAVGRVVGPIAAIGGLFRQNRRF